MVKNRLKDQKGLTLIELLAVLVILGIVAAIAVPSILNIMDNSKEKAIKADAKLILNSAKLYVADNGIPDDKTISKSELETEYIADVLSFKEEYEITVTDNGDVEFSDKATVNIGEQDGVKVDFKTLGLSEIDDQDRVSS